MNGWHIYVTVAEAGLLDNPQMSDFRKANMWLKACHSTEYWAVLVLRGWLEARLPLCTSLTPCRFLCVGGCACVCVRVYIFMQWVFKELSTEAGFPQTIITSTPDTPNFLFWYFFFPLSSFSFANPKGENPQHPACRIEMIFSPCPCGCPLKVRTWSYVGPAYSSAREEKSCVKE